MKELVQSIQNISRLVISTSKTRSWTVLKPKSHAHRQYSACLHLHGNLGTANFQIMLSLLSLAWFQQICLC